MRRTCGQRPRGCARPSSRRDAGTARPAAAAGPRLSFEPPHPFSDRDARGRLRLDAVARYLQDVASDDVDETGWGAPKHLWVVRHVRIEVVAPPVDDDHVELATWSSGSGALAAARRMSLVGDRGGRVELDSVWVHLGPDARPARIGDFDPYAEAAAGRVITTRLELPEPSGDGNRAPWPLRATDVDLLGHVNNAAYWHAVEQVLQRGIPDPARPLRARLDHRHSLDVGEPVELASAAGAGRLDLAFLVGDVARAVAVVEAL
ncbi:MAG: acyl-ACP thioesterase domain-containing protein [Gaiellaceae bacterium]